MQCDLKISKEIAILKSHGAHLNTSGDGYVSEVEGTKPHLNPFPKDNSCDSALNRFLKTAQRNMLTHCLTLSKLTIAWRNRTAIAGEIQK